MEIGWGLEGGTEIMRKPLTLNPNPRKKFIPQEMSKGPGTLSKSGSGLCLVQGV